MLGVGRRGIRWADGAPMSGGARPSPEGLGERDAWVVLAGARGVGPVSFGRLVAAFGSAGAVLREAGSPGALARLMDASATSDAPPALTLAAARTIVEAVADPDRALAAVRRAGVAVVTQQDSSYPSRLRSIELPPPVLFVAGDVRALAPARSVAVADATPHVARPGHVRADCGGRRGSRRHRGVRAGVRDRRGGAPRSRASRRANRGRRGRRARASLPGWAPRPGPR